MRKASLVTLLIGWTTQCLAQSDNAVPPANEKKTDQYVAVQLNGLIRQVFNFNNSTTPANVNPYLLTYNINSKKTGWGLRAGIGYNYLSNTTDDGITSAVNDINDLQLRIGIEKAFVLSDKWSAGVGIDGLLNMNNDNTNTTIHSFDTVTTKIKSLGTGFGGGPMGWLRYSCTPKILIGTEASFYYVSTTLSNTTTTIETDPNGGGFPNSQTTESKTKPKNASGVFNSPLVFYLIVKF